MTFSTATSRPVRRRNGPSLRLDVPVSGRALLPRPNSEAFARIAEVIARFIGTARFLVIQTAIVLVWISLNIAMPFMRWDPYPFILLNLAFSTQAAYAAPLILLAQNRQDDRDRASLTEDRAAATRMREDTEFLAREIAALRLGVAESATRQYVRGELTHQLESLRGDIEALVGTAIRAVVAAPAATHPDAADSGVADPRAADLGATLFGATPGHDEHRSDMAPGSLGGNSVAGGQLGVGGSGNGRSNGYASSSGAQRPPAMETAADMLTPTTVHGPRSRSSRSVRRSGGRADARLATTASAVSNATAVSKAGRGTGVPSATRTSTGTRTSNSTHTSSGTRSSSGSEATSHGAEPGNTRDSTSPSEGTGGPED